MIKYDRTPKRRGLRMAAPQREERGIAERLLFHVYECPVKSAVANVTRSCHVFASPRVGDYAPRLLPCTARMSAIGTKLAGRLLQTGRTQPNPGRHSAQQPNSGKTLWAFLGRRFELLSARRRG